MVAFICLFSSISTYLELFLLVRDSIFLSVLLFDISNEVPISGIMGIFNFFLDSPNDFSFPSVVSLSPFKITRGVYIFLNLFESY